MESVSEKLRDFACYFVGKIDAKLASSRAILEEHQVPAPGSAVGNVVAGLASAVPTIGKGLGKVVEKGDAFVVGKLDKDEAVALSSLVYLQRSDGEGFRRKLLEAAFEVFACFEGQLVGLTCSGGATRALQKMGYDAARRFLSYAVEVKLQRLDVEDVVKGVVYHVPGIKVTPVGRSVEDVDGRSWSTDKIFWKVGVYSTETSKCYSNKHTNAKKYGYRRKFAHESEAELEERWMVDDVTFTYTSNLQGSFDNYLEELKEFVAKQNPDEFAEYDRQLKHEELLKDLEDKHRQAEEDRSAKAEEASQHRLVLHEELKEHAEGQHKEVKEMLVEIVRKQDLLVPEALPPAYEEVERIVVQKLGEHRPQEDEPVLKRLEREIKEDLKKIDPTMHPEFRKLKKKWGF